LRQDLRINPRLYQAMDLLYMPLLDLQQHLKQELLTNPFLEMQEPGEDEETDERDKDEEDSTTDADAEAVADEAADAQPADSEAPAAETAQDETDWEDILLDGFETSGGVREQSEEREYIEPVTVEH